MMKMEKKILPELSLFYKKAELVKSISKGIDKWYIEFWQGDTEDFLQRFRPTFSINRIKNRKERKKSADSFIELIDELLEEGVTAESIMDTVHRKAKRGLVKEVKPKNSHQHKNIFEVFNAMIAVRCKSEVRNTAKTYRSTRNIFNDYLNKKKIGGKRCIDFSKVDAIGFSDWLQMRDKCSGATHNNLLRHVSAVFEDIKARDYIDYNYLADVPRKKKLPPKKRRPPTDEELAVIAKYIHDTDIWLFRAILLEYYCFMRAPSELQRLKFYHFDFQNGTIELGEDVVFKSKKRYATIPKVALPYFMTPDFVGQPTNYFVFGRNFVPNSLRPVTDKYINQKHQEALDVLKEQGLIGNTEGLTAYSWKDKGITDMANDDSISIFKTSTHAGHSDPRTTMIYYHQNKTSPEIREYSRRLF
jgi:integrase